MEVGQMLAVLLKSENKPNKHFLEDVLSKGPLGHSQKVYVRKCLCSKFSRFDSKKGCKSMSTLGVGEWVVCQGASRPNSSSQCSYLWSVFPIFSIQGASREIKLQGTGSGVSSSIYGQPARFARNAENTGKGLTALQVACSLVL